MPPISYATFQTLTQFCCWWCTAKMRTQICIEDKMAWTGVSAAERLNLSAFGLKNLTHRGAFNAAEDKVQKQAGAVDGGLASGMLCCSTCGSMLQGLWVGNIQRMVDGPRIN